MKEEKRNIPRIRFKEFAGDNANAWELRKFSELYTRVTEKNDLSFGKDKIISVANMYYKNPDDIKSSSDEYMKTYNIFRLGDIAFEGNKSKKFSYGRFVENDIGDGIISHVFNVFRPLEKKDINFWKYYINNENIMGHILRRVTTKATMMTNLVSKDFLKAKIKVPNGEEQQQIGNFFKQLDSLITLHQRKLELYQMLKKTLLSKLFPKNDEKYPEIRFKGFTDAWELRKLSEVARRYDNLRIPISEGKRERGNIPYYGANGIQDYVKGFTHQGEFVLVAEDGANDVINYPVRYVKGKIWVNNHAHVLQGKSDILDNRFLTNAIKSIKIAPFLVGGGRSKLNSDVMMNMSINMASLREQQKIGSFFKQLDSLITLHQRKLESLEMLKKTLLQQMFV